MFSTLYDAYFAFQMHLKMSSAIHFNLDQSKILSSGNELNNALGKCINIFKYLFLLFPQYLKIKKSYVHNQMTYFEKTTQNIQYSRKSVFVTNVTVFVTCVKRKSYIIKEFKKKKCPSGCIKHCTPKMTSHTGIDRAHNGYLFSKLVILHTNSKPFRK